MPAIEPKPKKIIQDSNFTVNIALTSREQQDYVVIRGLIKTGGSLAPFYRRSVTADRLLKTLKVLHLHLGGPGSNAILYVIQYPAHVLFVRVDSHIHLDDLPPGRRLNLLGAKKLENTLRAQQSEASTLRNKIRSVLRIGPGKADKD